MTFHKYPKIRALGHDDIVDIFAEPEDDIHIEEKIDGANFRFMFKDGRIIFGSRTQSLGDDDQEIGGNWKRCVEFVKEKVKDHVAKKELEGLVFYGECCVKHTMKYDWDKIPPFLGFDAYHLKDEKFLENKNAVFVTMDLPVVQHVKIGKAGVLIQQTIDDEFVPKSEYAEEKAEGIVFKNYTKQMFGKYVRAAFKEENTKVFGGSKKWVSEDAAKVVAQYCTTPRIDKIIFKLIDDGEKLEKRMMHLLPKMVCDDIYEEHGKEIFDSRMTIDFHKLKKGVTKRCFHTLCNMITNNEIQKKGEDGTGM